MSHDPDALLATARRLPPGPVATREFLDGAAGDPVALALALRHPLPAALLEAAARHACARDARVAAALVRNPATPRAGALPLLPRLLYLDLAHAAGDARLAAAVRQRAGATLLERLPDLVPGEAIAVARLASGRVLEVLLARDDERIVDAALESRHLTASRLAALLVAATDVRPLLYERVASCWRFREEYGVRRALALSARCPLAIALGQLSSLTAIDLREIAGSPSLHPLVRVAAGRLGSGRLTPPRVPL